jgi:DNA-binding transcriptional regulator YdaS (Cro superfamily)
MKIKNPVAVLAERVGSQTKLAYLLGVTPQAVSLWRRKKIPAERVVGIEAATGVSRKVLRPDLYHKERGN